MSRKSSSLAVRETALETIDRELNTIRDAARKKFDTFENAILPDRLNIGIQCLKAHLLFGIMEPGKRNPKGRNQATSTVDVASPQGFEGWLAERHPWLKKATAYRWMTAVKGLGLDENASKQQVSKALKLLKRKGPVTLKSLCDAALEAIGPPAPPEQTMKQSEFQFLVDGLKDFREQGEHICTLKNQLLENPDLHKVACARAYSILFELTGTNWAPSDEPDALALVDPDSITL